MTRSSHEPCDPPPRDHDPSIYCAEMILGAHAGAASNDASPGEAEQRTTRLTDMLRMRQFFDELGPSLYFGLLTIGGEVLFANRAALQAACLQPEDVLGKSFETTPWWTIPYSRERLRVAIRDAAHGIAARFDVDVQALDGRRVTLDFSLQPMQGANGNVEYLVVYARDVTDRIAAFAPRESG